MTASAASSRRTRRSGRGRADGADLVDPELRRDRRLRRASATGFGDDWLRIGGRKLFSDGSMGAGTAAFFDPYTDDPATSGLLIHDPDSARAADLRRRCRAASSWSSTPSAIGRTRSCSTSSSGCAPSAATATGRPRIEHAQVVRPTDQARFQALGVIASLQPSHCIDDMRWAEARIGTARCAIAYNVKSFVDAGARSRVRHRLVRRAARPDARSLRRRHATVPRRHAARWLVSGGAHHARAGGRVLHAGSAYAEFAEDRKGRLKRRIAGRPGRAVARHLRGPAARDPRRPGRS